MPSGNPPGRVVSVERFSWGKAQCCLWPQDGVAPDIALSTANTTSDEYICIGQADGRNVCAPLDDPPVVAGLTLFSSLIIWLFGVERLLNASGREGFWGRVAYRVLANSLGDDSVFRRFGVLARSGQQGAEGVARFLFRLVGENFRLRERAEGQDDIVVRRAFQLLAEIARADTPFGKRLRGDIAARASDASNEGRVFRFEVLRLLGRDMGIAGRFVRDWLVETARRGGDLAEDAVDVLGLIAGDLARGVRPDTSASERVVLVSTLSSLEEFGGLDNPLGERARRHLLGFTGSSMSQVAKEIIAQSLGRMLTGTQSDKVRALIIGRLLDVEHRDILVRNALGSADMARSLVARYYIEDEVPVERVGEGAHIGLSRSIGSKSLLSMLVDIVWTAPDGRGSREVWQQMLADRSVRGEAFRASVLGRVHGCDNNTIRRVVVSAALEIAEGTPSLAVLGSIVSRLRISGGSIDAAETVGMGVSRVYDGERERRLSALERRLTGVGEGVVVRSLVSDFGLGTLLRGGGAVEPNPLPATLNAFSETIAGLLGGAGGERTFVASVGMGDSSAGRGATVIDMDRLRGIQGVALAIKGVVETARVRVGR